ncbi:hypothetical protein D3C81_1430200 [compost metagenome]
MLAQQARIVHVHQQAEREGHAHAHLARLVDVPEHQHQRHHVGDPQRVAPRHQVEQERQHEAERDKRGIDRPQQVLGVGHRWPSLASLASLAAGALAAAALAAAARAAADLAPLTGASGLDSTLSRGGIAES